MTYIEYCIAVAQLAAIANFRVTSWWRSPLGNRRVGGHPQSYHLVGMGLDLVPDSEVDKATIKVHGPRLGFQVLDEGNHLHLEPSSR